MKMRTISQYGKNGGEPCPKNLMEVSNCEKEGFANNSVPDCGSKVEISATWSEWNSWSGCIGNCGKQGKVIYSYK